METSLSLADTRETVDGHDDDATRASLASDALSTGRFGKILLEEHNNRPIPRVELLGTRFLVAMLVGVGVVGGLLSIIKFYGLVIQHDVDEASADISLYQTINGFVWAGVARLLEEYFRVVFAVMTVYLGNCQWHSRDRPREASMSSAKRNALLLFTPMALYVLNVGISSVFIETKSTGIRRALTDDDLVTVVSLSAKGMTREVVPFKISNSSQCGTTPAIGAWTDVRPIVGSGGSGGAGGESLDPTIAQIEATSVTFGFPTRDWHEDALRGSLTTNDTPTFNASEAFNASSTGRVEEKFQDFLRQANITVELLHELLIQGRTLFTKSLSDSQTYNAYPCTRVDHLEDDVYQARLKGNKSVKSLIDQTGFSVFDEGSGYAGLRKCHGASIAWNESVDLRAADYRNLQGVLRLSDFFQDALDDLTLKIDFFQVSPQVKLTALTIDLPYDAKKGYRIDWNEASCESNGTFKVDSPEHAKKKSMSLAQWKQYETEVCDPRYLSYADSKHLCSSSSCVFKDESTTMTYKNQLLIAPYMKHCDMTKLDYDHEVAAWFPSGCTPQKDAAILYGGGTFVNGDFYPSRKSAKDPNVMAPVLANARRHRIVSVAKMEWQFEDISRRFDAECAADGGCDGILHALDSANTTDPSIASVLVVGRDDVANLSDYSLKHPVTLLMLNELKFYYGENNQTNNTYYVWDRLDMARLNTNYTTSQGLHLRNNQCSLLIDGFLAHQEANHYYMDNPLQPLYTSALFYLFQDAVVKEVYLPSGGKRGVVDLTNRIIGHARMSGDVAIREIRYSIPLVSAVATFVGIASLLLYLVVLLRWPRDVVKLSHEKHFPAQYAQVLIDDRYPSAVHERRLELPNDDVVEMDDYVVDSITFYHPLEPELKVVL